MLEVCKFEESTRRMKWNGAMGVLRECKSVAVKLSKRYHSSKLFQRNFASCFSWFAISRESNWIIINGYSRVPLWWAWIKHFTLKYNIIQSVRNEMGVKLCYNLTDLKAHIVQYIIIYCFSKKNAFFISRQRLATDSWVDVEKAQSIICFFIYLFLFPQTENMS